MSIQAFNGYANRSRRCNMINKSSTIFDYKLITKFIKFNRQMILKNCNRHSFMEISIHPGNHNCCLTKINYLSKRIITHFLTTKDWNHTFFIIWRFIVYIRRTRKFQNAKGNIFKAITVCWHFKRINMIYLQVPKFFKFLWLLEGISWIWSIDW